jgi:CRP-like cAMP-binding protein
VLLEMVTRCAQSGDFVNAEKIHARMYAETPMALTATIAAGEAIDAHKGGMIDPEHLARWEGIYSQLTEEETTTFFYALQDMDYAGGEIVFKQGDVDGRLFLIEDGAVKMVCEDTDGSEDPDASEQSPIQELKAGDIFGADHFFSFSVCTYSAVAGEACRLKVLDKSHRFKWLAELPGLENKLQRYCSTLEKASNIIVEGNIERRSGASRSSSVKATIQTIDSRRLPEDWSRSVRFCEVSPGGASLELKLGKPEDAEALLGENLKISFTLQVAGAQKQAHVTARIVAIDFLPFGDCAMHIQFTKALSDKVVALF